MAKAIKEKLKSDLPFFFGVGFAFGFLAVLLSALFKLIKTVIGQVKK